MNREFKIIRNKIYTFRDAQVMVDREPTALYGVEAIRLSEQIKRNAGKYPDAGLSQNRG